MASSNNLSFKIFKQNNIFIINKMNILTEKANHNLKCILEMKENDTYIGQTGKLVPQEDFIQVNNIVDLEYAIYFTFHHYFCNGDTDQIYNNNIIQKLDTCIDNLYDNKQFNELFNEEQFGEIMNDIDNKLTDIKDKYYYKSPFFIFLLLPTLIIKEFRYGLFLSNITLALARSVGEATCSSINFLS